MDTKTFQEFVDKYQEMRCSPEDLADTVQEEAWKALNERGVKRYSRNVDSYSWSAVQQATVILRRRGFLARSVTNSDSESSILVWGWDRD